MGRSKSSVQILTDDEINRQLAELEHTYGMSSAEFLRKYNGGELGDDLDFIDWAGLLMVAERAGIDVHVPA